MIRDYSATAFAIDRFFRALRGTLVLGRRMFDSLTYLNFLLLWRKFSEPTMR